MRKQFLQGKHHTNIITRYILHRKGKLQTCIPNKHRHKDPQQNASKQKITIHQKHTLCPTRHHPRGCKDGLIYEIKSMYTINAIKNIILCSTSYY